MSMKVCPVCEMEEEDDALSCSMCGSDFEPEVKEASPEENPTTDNDNLAADIANMNLDEENTESNPEETKELSDEEKLLEETLNATASGTPDEKSENSVARFAEQFSDLGKIFGNLNNRLDRIFTTKGKLNYIAPLTIVVVSILLLSGVIGLAVSTVPTSDKLSSTGEPPSIATGAPNSGEPFNCEFWDEVIYEPFGKEIDGQFIYLTDSNENGLIDPDENAGCPVDMKFTSTFSFIFLNLILIITAIYIFNKLPNTSIIMPVLGFAAIEIILFPIYGGLLNNVIFALPLTIGLVCTIGLIVSGSILLIRTSLERPLDDPPGVTFYIFMIAAALLFSSVFYNYSLGPYSSCEDPASAEDIDYFQNITAQGGELNDCRKIGFNTLTTVSIDLGNGSNMMVLLSATFLFIGVVNYLISNTRINDIDEAKYFSMILSGLGLQFAILVFNVMTSDEGGLGFDENDTTLTIMALGVATVGMISFYRKRRGEAGNIGAAYFGIFAAGIFALFATFIAPVVLAGNEIKWPEDGDEQFNLLVSALVTAIGFALVYRYGSHKLRELSIASDAAMPNRQDTFAPTVPGQEKAMPEWTVDSAMEFLMNEYGDEFQVELKHTTEHTPDLELVEKTMMDTVDQSVEIRPAIEVDYDVDFHEIAEAYSTTRETVDEVITHLTSGKNIMLFGEPGTGKTALSNILLTKLCGEIEQPNGSKAPNYTIVTANAEWSNFDVIGGISPDDSGGYYFKDGYVAEAAKLCEKSIRERGKPHYLVIDEFNRANIDEAFGKLFTVFEYRDKQPLLTHKETGGAPFMMPPEFRIIGTMNTQDKNTLFNVGFALMRRFAFVEIGLPLPEDEYNRMPVFVYFKLKKLGLVPERPDGDPLWKFGEKCKHFASRKFDFYDEDGNMYNCHEKLVKFLAPGEPPKRGDETPLGVRTFRKIGPALLIDSMVTIFNSIKKYGPELALDRVIRSNIMPSLEGLERNEIRCMFLHAKEVLGPTSIVTETLDRMANSDSLSLF
ncbi:MAG: hypothetical protein CMA48_03310 [Euryarchaeota archaeon]|nr:hypothetical protein [Euryarchaeota archaeon]